MQFELQNDTQQAKAIRVEQRRRHGRVQPCIVEVFLEFLADAKDEDRRTMCEIARRYADKRGWK